MTGSLSSRIRQILQSAAAAGLAGGLILLLVMVPDRAAAVPSFARQTGLPCSRCHITFPELTEFGREFKLNGYTLSGPTESKVTAPATSTKAGLWINRNLPISAMLQIADTAVVRVQPGTQTGNVEFPQQFSVFLAGEVATHAGIFLQATYTGATDHLSLDNTDFRAANFTTLLGHQLIYGVDVNNNPTVEDLWNDTPAWGWPFTGPDSVPVPATAALVDGGLAQDVGGLGGYAMWRHHWYGDVTLYRSMHIGGPQPPNGQGFGVNITGLAPYWRGAWQTSWGGGTSFIEIGTYGLHVRSFPDAVSGLQDIYTDNAGDMQYERHIGNFILTAHSTFIHEHRQLYATFAAGNSRQVPQTLNTFRANAILHFGNRFDLGAGGFRLSGSSDAGLYPSGTAVTGSANHSPDSAGYNLQAGYWPVQNIEVSLLYTGYTSFNGASQNYDGLGRNASQNNSLFANLWLMF